MVKASEKHQDLGWPCGSGLNGTNGKKRNRSQGVYIEGAGTRGKEDARPGSGQKTELKGDLYINTNRVFSCSTSGVGLPEFKTT